MGVDDLQKAVAFYRDGLGLASDGVVSAELEHGAVAFFDLQGGLKLALWPRDSTAHDTGLLAQPASATEMTIGQNVNTRQEVDDIMTVVTAADATVIRPADETFWGGYSGYYQDPDGHVWEIVYNPALVVNE